MKENKRKYKKRMQKYFIPIADEFNVLTMTEEEKKDWYKQLDEYGRRNFHYKHYRDKDDVLRRAMSHPTIYAPVGATHRSYIQELHNLCVSPRKHSIGTQIVFQNINQLE